MQYQLRHYLSAEDLTIQVQLINNSITALQFNQQQKQVLPLPLLSTTPKAMIKSVLTKLQALMIVNRDRVFWPAVTLVGQDTWAPAFTDIHLYQGVSGMMLSFAYAGKLLEEPSFTLTAHQCLSSIRATVRERGIKAFPTVGGFSGLGGMIYAFASLQYLWQDDGLKNTIAELCQFLPELIAQDQQLDVIGGAAGALAALLAARDCLPPVLLQQLAEQCVDHLLDKFPQPTQVPLLGFSHGVAGMVWVLSKYNALFADERVKAWICAGLAYERNKFSEQDCNWPDMRSETLRFMTSWCHGAPGIGLARCDMKSYWQDEYSESEIQYALQATLQQGFSGQHNLCHGSLGNLELLLNISHAYPSLLSAVDYQYYRQQCVANIATGLQCEVAPSLATPGLMTGMAGVAYQLLRLIYPDRVPSVLLLSLEN